MNNNNLIDLISQTKYLILSFVETTKLIGRKLLPL